ncbi:MAG: dipicolinate synthase subunit DpsA [Clostridia bacterium]|nr:dipicolinate synthase subunit DpsA [Clostridia bacterium]
MNHVLTFAFIGGDLRQIRAINQLSAAGHEVQTFGLDQARFPEGSSIKKCKKLSTCIDSADVVVLPLPYNTSPDVINAGLSENTIYIREVLDTMADGQLLLAGRADGYLKALAELHHIRLIDYMEREEMTVLNTVPTVEGAIAIAMAETPYTIHGCRCLVLGYGRIGKLLSHTLKSLGADTHVSARKHSDLAWIKSYAMTGIPIKNLAEKIGDYNIIFNTIPATILDFHLLSRISNDCLIIDLASKPGGVDFETARELGKKVIWALSLPGKVAPDTAGDIMKDTIVNILEELGV